MLVARVIGSCPRCKAPNAFGNVNVSRNVLTRGCGFCSYSEKHLLPTLSKAVIYLDQSFLSHAFRDQLPAYRTCISLIRECAHSQLVVCPRSSIHEIETHLWRDDRQQDLWNFIKRTSRGHEFNPVYEIKKTQLLRAFKRFLVADQAPYPLDVYDALPEELNEWEDYFDIEILLDRDDSEQARRGKQTMAGGLLALFERWRKSNSTFEEHLGFEFESAAQAYVTAFSQMMARVALGDFAAFYDSRIEAEVIEIMVSELKEAGDTDYTKIGRFFRSPYFREVPYESISCRLVTILREQVKRGHYVNARKARSRLSGFFYDVEHVAVHAPYCDIMFVDSEFHGYIADDRSGIVNTYSTELYSKRNIADFENRLRSYLVGLSGDLRSALDLVYPSVE